MLFISARFPFIAKHRLEFKLDLVLGGILEAFWNYFGRVLGGQDAPKTDQDGAKTRQDGAKTAQDGAKTGQGGIKTPQDAAKTLQDGAETVQERQITKTLKNQRKNKVFERVLELSWEGFGRPRRAQEGPRWRQDASRWRQDGLRWRQDGPRRHQDVPRCRQDAPRRRRDGPRASNHKNIEKPKEKQGF